AAILLATMTEVPWARPGGFGSLVAGGTTPRSAAINLAASPITDVRILPKFVFDRAFALVALTGLAPVMLVIACLIKL
ncbi:hypothetical protein, partial [Klebsiella pneumoniae]|uniref:hypothetical protein n=1 Tax=Klebsiella pneumoniae TaxID=573 RepID=UPI0022B7E2D6